MARRFRFCEASVPYRVGRRSSAPPLKSGRELVSTQIRGAASAPAPCRSDSAARVFICVAMVFQSCFAVYLNQECDARGRRRGAGSSSSQTRRSRRARGVPARPAGGCGAHAVAPRGGRPAGHPSRPRAAPVEERDDFRHNVLRETGRETTATVSRILGPRPRRRAEGPSMTLSHEQIRNGGRGTPGGGQGLLGRRERSSS